MNELLKELTGTVGLTGSETPAAEVVRKLWEPLVDELRVDRVGNVIGIKRGDGPDGERHRLAAIGHLDQIGMMVYAIEDGGFLRLQMVGGVDKRILPGQILTVFGTETLRGVVGATPPHLQSPGDREKVVGWDDLYLDLGMPEDEVRKKVRVGDAVSYPTEYTELNDKYRAVAGCDDRSAVAAITWALKVAQRQRHFHDIYAIASVQEEWTGLGAIISTYTEEPDVAIVVDVDQGRHEGVSDKDSIELGKGPSITYGLNNHAGLVEAAEKAAGKGGVTFQKLFWPSPYGTDGAQVETTRAGIPTINFGVPLRYMHSTVETLHLDDLKNLGRLIVAVADSDDLPVIKPIEW